METGIIPTPPIYRNSKELFPFPGVANSIIHSAESPNAQLLEFKNLVTKIGI